MARTALTRAAGTVAFLTIVSRILGFTREASLAAVFGATQDVDAYLVAQAAPYIFLGLVSYAITTTFIPVYSRIRAQKGRRAAFAMANTIVRAIGVLGLLLVLVGQIGADYLVKAIAPGFDDPSLELTSYLTRIIFPIVFFQLVSGVVTGILQAEKKFAVVEVGGLVQNLAIIGATLLFGSHYGISAVAAGLLLGVSASLAVKLPALRQTGFRWVNAFNLKDPNLRRMLILMIPALIGAGADRLNLLVDRILASSLPEGRIAALNYAVRLHALAPAILGSSIITVLYPSLASLAAKENWKRFANDLVQSLRLIHFLLAPILIGAIILRAPLVRIVFERGAFDSAATHETTWAFLFLAVGMAFTSMQNLMGRAFFALQDTTTPMYIGLGTVGINIVANLVLIGPLEQGGLALGTSLASFFGLFLSLAIMRRKSPVGLPLKSLLDSMVRVLAAGGVMGATVWGAYPKVLGLVQDGGLIGESVGVIITTLLGAITFVLLAWILRVPELRIAITLIKKTLFSGSAPG